MSQGVEGLLGSTRSSEEAGKRPPREPLGASLVLSSKEPACNAEDSGSTPGSGRSPGEEMVTHSSILAWRVPCTEESGGLESMGSQRVRGD